MSEHRSLLIKHFPMRFCLLPILILVADLIFRARVIYTFSLFDWTCYLASFVLMVSLWWLIFHWIKRLSKKEQKTSYSICLITISALHIVTLSFGYSIYFANGDLPDLFLLSFIVSETENAAIIFQDSITWIHYFVAITGTVLFALCVHFLAKKSSSSTHITRRTLWCASLTTCVTLWFSWIHTCTQGQTFVPLVRIPLVIGMYLQNEIKGINPKPIYLPERQPLQITTKLPQAPVSVILILNESLRRDRLSLYGYSRKTTTFIDELARNYQHRFFRFDRTYTNSTTTLLSVPSILNGIAPYQPLSQRVIAPNIWQWAKAAQMTTFYHTSHNCDWLGLGAFITDPPPDHSWDMRSENLPQYRDMGCDDHITVDRAVAHLHTLAKSPQPFLGVIHLNTNHYPYNTAAPYQKWNVTASDRYDNTILEVDTHTKRIVDALKCNGQLENTVILFASDHGEGFNEHGYTAHFYCHFAETVIVPLFILLPDQTIKKFDIEILRKNATVNTQNLDIIPTILDAIGAWEHPDVASYCASMKGSSLFRPIDPQRSILITNTDEVMPSTIGLSSVKGEMHYMLRTSSKTPIEDLYNIAKDPLELNNLWPSITDTQRQSYRNQFRDYPVSAAMLDKAFPAKKLLRQR